MNQNILQSQKFSKNEFRKMMKKRLSAMDPYVKKSADLKANEDLTKILSYLYEESKTFILSYSSLETEVDLTPLNKFLANKGQLVLPRIGTYSDSDSDSDSTQIPTLELYLVKDLDEQLIHSKYGILEPDPNKCELVQIDNIGVALVPGLAFDVQRNRLGRGGGYYDRLFSNQNQTSIELFGVCYKLQFMGNAIQILPTEPHDVKMDQIYIF